MGDSNSAEQQISNLLFRYARLMDGAEFEAVATMFQRATYAGIPGDQLLEVLRGTIRLHDGKMGTRHVTSNVEIELDDDGNGALVRSYFTVFQQLPDFPFQPIVAGHYEDRVARDESGWHFTERKIEMTSMGDLSHHLTYQP